MSKETKKTPQQATETEKGKNREPLKGNEKEAVAENTAGKPTNGDKKAVAPSKAGVWQTWLRPVVALVVICLIASGLLGITNSITQPLILQNAAKTAEEARKQLLPSATGFTDVTPNPLPENILSVYKAAGDAGYVIEAYGTGYGGKVPAMVAINADGKITGVKFLDNNETPGLGKKLITDTKFAAQFAGKKTEEAIEGNQIDGVAAATLSTNGALAAINTATQYYNIALMGGTLAYDLPEAALKQLMPNATSWQQFALKADKIAGAYLGSDGTIVLVAQGKGAHTIYAAAALDAKGTITGLWLDTSQETPNYGLGISENTEYINQFVGKTDTGNVQGIAGATLTSKGITSAVNAILAAYPAAKEAA